MNAQLLLKIFLKAKDKRLILIKNGDHLYGLRFLLMIF